MPERSDVEEHLPPELEAILDDLRVVYLVEPAPDVAADHVARMAAAVAVDHRPADQHRAADELARRRRRRTALAAAAGVGTITFLTGGLAAASGNLPNPVQDVVSRVASPFGVHLPTGEEDDRAPAPPAEPDGGSGGGEPGREAPSDAGPGSTTVTTAPPGEVSPSTDEDPSVEPPEDRPRSGGSNAPVPTPSTRPEQAPDGPPGQSDDADKGNKPAEPPGQQNGTGKDKQPKTKEPEDGGAD